MKQLHWAVTGKNFSNVHKDFDKIHDIAHEASDLVAERIAQLGYVPDGRPETIGDNSEDYLDAIRYGCHEAVKEAAHCLGEVCKCVREYHHKCSDMVTQNLLVNISTDLEKMLWMMNAQTMEGE